MVALLTMGTRLYLLLLVTLVSSIEHCLSGTVLRDAKLGSHLEGEACKGPYSDRPFRPHSHYMDNGPHCAEVYQEIIDHDMSYVSPAKWRQGRLLYSRGRRKEGGLQCGDHIVKITFRGLF